MRLVRFEGDDGTVIEFHPRLTVVGGLTDAARARLIETARALPRGATTGARGAIEVHGVLMELDADTVELLELDSDVDVVLEPDQLAGADAPWPEAGRNGNGGTVAGRGDDPELEAARAELARAARAAQAAQEERARRAAGEEQLSGRIAALQAELEAALAQREPEAAAALERARAELGAVESTTGRAADPETERSRAALEKKVRVLAEQHRILRAEVHRLQALDPGPVREALDRLGGGDVGVAAGGEAARLADELEALERDRAASTPAGTADHQQLVELTARRDAAYDAFVAAEAQLRTPDLDPAKVSRLEAIHDEIFDLDHKRARFGAARQRRRILELKEEEDALLAELGFASWTNYVMGVSNADAEAERLRRFEVAKATYEFAEEELAKVATAPVPDEGPDPRVEARYRELVEHAAALLGEWPDDPVGALRAAPTAGSGADPAVVVEALRAALVAQGVDAPGDDAAAVAAVARQWLAEAETAASDATEIAGDIQRLEGQLAQMNAELEQLAAPTAGEPPDLTAARAAVDEAKARLARHEAAERTAARVRHQLDELGSRDETAGTLAAEAAGEVARAEEAVAAARARVAELEEAAAAAPPMEPPDAPSAAAMASRTARARREARDRDRGALEWQVLGRMAQQRSLSFVGSVPLVIDDAFRGWAFEDIADVLGRIRRMSEVIQVIILTDDVDIAGWARELGRDKALVLDLATV